MPIENTYFENLTLTQRRHGLELMSKRMHRGAVSITGTSVRAPLGARKLGYLLALLLYPYFYVRHIPTFSASHTSSPRVRAPCVYTLMLSL